MATIAPTPTQASRFLGQAAFGGNQQSINEVIALGYIGWLNRQFALPSSTSHKDWLIAKGFHVPDAANANRNGITGSRNSLWQKLFSSPDVLRQRMVLALSEIFVINGGSLNISWRSFAVANYLDRLEQNAFGNFRSLLESVTLSSAMGAYLNMKGSKKANPTAGTLPDENYAREVMQLFTIGLYQLNTDGTVKKDAQGKALETYTNADVTGLAAALTGWKQSSAIDPNATLEKEAYQHGLPMVLDASQHASIEKRFLGIAIPANTDGSTSLKLALDRLFNHANVGPFIGKQLIQRFVKSNPSGAYVARVANVFANNGAGVRGDMKAVLRAVLMDTEARTAPTNVATATVGKLREPVIRLLQWGRSFGASNPDGLWNVGDTSADTALGQMPIASPTVFNFFRPGYRPAGFATLAASYVAPEFQITNEPSVASYINYMYSTINNGRAALKVDYTAEKSFASDATILVQRYSLWLVGARLSASVEASIIAAVNSINASTDAGKLNRIYAAQLLIMSSPEYLVQK
jgi:uncharacterized protein (DUF1800 family)